MTPIELYVSPDGNDRWSGRLPEPNDERTDGPFATVGGARDAVRGLKRAGALSGPVTVRMRGGRYRVKAPIEFTPDDSGPITYAAYEGERAIIDGGRQIDGWTSATINGVDAWVAHVPEVAAGEWSFSQLFVNGERRSRGRMPREGFYRMADVPGADASAAWGGIFDGGDTFGTEPGDVRKWKNLSDVEIVILHWWIEDRAAV